MCEVYGRWKGVGNVASVHKLLWIRGNIEYTEHAYIILLGIFIL